MVEHKDWRRCQQLVVKVRLKEQDYKVLECMVEHRDWRRCQLIVKVRLKWQHYKVQECMVEHSDWRRCQLVVKARLKGTGLQIPWVYGGAQRMEALPACG